MEKGFTDFLGKLRTTEDLYLLISDLEEAQDLVGKRSFDILSKRLKDRVSLDFLEQIKNLEKSKKIPLSQEDLAAYFKGLKEYLLNLPKMKIELAFEPSEEFTSKMARFIQESSSSKVILDISPKPSILAGVTIDYRGVFRDYSYVNKFQQIMKEKFSKEYGNL